MIKKKPIVLVKRDERYHANQVALMPILNIDGSSTRALMSPEERRKIDKAMAAKEENLNKSPVGKLLLSILTKSKNAKKTRGRKSAELGRMLLD